MSSPVLPPLHLNWQSVSQIPQCFWYMFDKQMACDVTFLVGVDLERIGSHSFVLMSRSSVFFQTFSQGLPDKEILMPEVEPNEFGLFMRFLYTGELSQHHYDNNMLMTLAEQYNVTDLLKLVLNTRLHDMNPEDFCPFVQRYKFHMTGPVKFKCLEYVFNQPDKVFKSEHFPVLPISFVADVLKDEHLVTDEETICTAMLLWAAQACKDRGIEVNGKNQRLVLHDVLYQIRFPVLSQDYFTENISETGVLTEAEELQILKFFLNRNKSFENKTKFKFQKRQAPDLPFTYTPEIQQENPDCAAGGPDVTMGTLRPNDSLPTLHHLHSGRQGIIERFTEQGTGWGYRGNKRDAIAFTVNKDIRIDYVFVYGNCRDNGVLDVSLILRDKYLELSKTDMKVQSNVRTPYYEIGLENDLGTYGIHLQAKQEYHIILGVKGDTGYYGKGGKSSVTSEDVIVDFRKSSYSTNNTSVAIGQIAGFRFTVLTENESV